MVNETETNKHIAAIELELSQIDASILQQFPIETYINEVESLPEVLTYQNFTPELQWIFDQLTFQYGEHALTLYHKLALVTFIKKSSAELQHIQVPPEVFRMCEERFERVIAAFSEQPDDFYDHKKDTFCKDLGLCSMRMVPVGCELAEISGIGRRHLFTGGITQFFSLIRFFLLGLRGFKPYYEIHLDMRYIDTFNPEGQDQCYIRIAELLQLNPRIKGLFGVSWFFDPRLEQISPRLLYLRKRPQQRGAKIYRTGSSKRAIRLSTLKSQTRRRLYEEGKYKPTSYLMVWPREDIIAWAEKYKRKCKVKITESRIDNRIENLTEEISRLDKDIILKYPIKRYLDIVKSYLPLHFYRNSDPRLIEVFETIKSTHNCHALALYHKLAMSHFIKSSIEKLDCIEIPHNVYCLYHDWFDRIIDDFTELPDDFYDHKKDQFCKDLAVCSQRLIPIGFLAEISGLGKQFLGAGGLRQFVNGLLYTITKAHGVKPFYAVHLDMRYLRKNFSKRGWVKCYLNIADLLKINTHIKGMIGGSWFYDPQLEQISPHLAHLRLIPEQYGGKVYRQRTSAQDLRLAAANSPQRSELIFSGKYVPAHHVIIWPRKGLIKWAEEYRKKSAVKEVR